jgi:isopentenyl diphosphate isomerase/L-lactate dehydrogenase-like FMN-dependent dehydrogenase
MQKWRAYQKKQIVVKEVISWVSAAVVASLIVAAIAKILNIFIS